jgi:hypothetical protein
VAAARIAICSLLVFAACLALTPGAQALPRTNPADRLLRVPVDELRYEHARGCRRSMSKGALALSKWLARNTRGEYWGGVRCERLGRSSFSMHAEGRAVDWHLDARVPADRREGRRLLGLLFGVDSQGNENALARRMGIIEAIWDCRYHGFWMTGGESKRYSPCSGRKGRSVDPTTAHRDHIHLSLSWSGARMRTSYWRYAWLGSPLPEIEPVAPAQPAPGPLEVRAGPPDEDESRTGQSETGAVVNTDGRSSAG